MLLPLLHGREESSFPDVAPLNDMNDSESMVAITSGDFGVVIGYQVDEFIHTWSVDSVCC